MKRCITILFVLVSLHPILVVSLNSYLPPGALGRYNNQRGLLSLRLRKASALYLAEDETKESSVTRTGNFGWHRQNIDIAIPALAGMLVDPLLSLMDTFYIGRVGSIELAALGACTSIFHLAFNAFRATTAATTALVAGANDSEEAKSVIVVSLIFASFVGLAVGAALLAGGNYALNQMGVSSSSPLHSPATKYLFARAWAAPVVLVIVVAEGAFRGYRQLSVPLVASLAAALVNMILDPVLMFLLGMGVRGAAVATVLSQVSAAAVYAVQLIRQRLLPSSFLSSGSTQNKPDKSLLGNASANAKGVSTFTIVASIIKANIAMITKQGSLLLGWAYATARATRLGHATAAAHQVAVSIWLIFALILDSSAVSAQVIGSRQFAAKDANAVASLTQYFGCVAIGQGVIAFLLVSVVGGFVPGLFSPDLLVQVELRHVMPALALTQFLVSCTLVAEGLAVAANQFWVLACGTAISSVLTVSQISQQTTLVGIWGRGILSLFAGRLATALLACLIATRNLKKEVERQQLSL